jgi:hypothetical protein
MNKMKIGLTAALFVFAVGGAIASKRLPNPAYYKPSATSPCQEILVCSSIGSAVCTVAPTSQKFSDTNCTIPITAFERD